MMVKNKGLGFAAFLILIGGFLIVRPLMESLLGRMDDKLEARTTAVVLALSGILTFWLSARLDRRAEINVFSKEAWTSRFFESQHIVFYLPLRAAGVLFFCASFLF